MIVEKPPILTGNVREDNGKIRDYLFRLAKSLEQVSQEALDVQKGKAVAYDRNGKAIYSDNGLAKQAMEEVRKRATELKSLIVKSTHDVMEYTDGKVEEYNSLYVAKSDFGTFEENIYTVIENTARGIVESYDYASQIQGVQDSIGLMQQYFTAINGEIRRGIVEDPSNPGQYVTGIAISQSLKFTGQEMTGDDGYTYYYLDSGQTFGLYTSTGWQFWIDGYKMGWFDSQDSYLHVYYVVAEQGVQIGDAWQIVAAPDGSLFEIKYIEV